MQEMQSPQTLTRRIVPALAVTVVATLVLGAVVVSADVATDDTPLLPESFGIATPQQGDAWRYNVTLSGKWTFGAEDELKVGRTVPFGEFQWATPATVRGGDGRMHDVNRFEATHLSYAPMRVQAAQDFNAYSGSDGESNTCTSITSAGSQQDDGESLCASSDPYWTVADTSGWMLAGGRTIVARGEVESDYFSRTDYGFTPSPVAVQEDDSYQSTFSEDGLIQYPIAEVPCFIFNPLQGGNVSLASDVGLFDACTLGDQFLSIPEGLSFHASGVETVAGVQAVRFDAAQNGTYSVWFSPAVPYPVRVLVDLPSERDLDLEAGDLDAPGDRSALLEMVGFAAGDADLDLVDDPADVDAAPDLVKAPWLTFQDHRIGLEEAGVDHPFPLSVAFAKGMEDQPGGYADLKTYLELHPEAYVASALYGEGMFADRSTTAQAGQNRGWSIVMTDGKEPFDFVVTQQSFEAFLPADARGQAEEPTPVYSFDRGYGYGYPYMEGSASLPTPSQIPDQVPTVASLLARWAAFDASNLTANTWGFTFGCAAVEDGNDVCRPELAFVAGVQRDSEGSAFAGPQSFLFNTPVPLPGDPYGAEQYVLTQRLVAFEGDGTATEQVIFDHREYRSAVADGIPGESSTIPDFNSTSDAGYAVKSQDVTGIPSSATRWVPEPKQAASIGFMGLVVGALYWIWPKLGMVGLFSRLHRGELLDHPARAKLVQIVESQPGIHFHDLAQKAELANGTAVHHLRKLSDSGHINVRRSGRYTCYFPGGRVDPGQAAAAPLLKSDGAKQVLEAVRSKPGMSNLEVAQATGLQPSTVNYHVQRLSQAGLLAAMRDGRSVRLHPGIRLGNDPALPGVSGAVSVA